MTHTKFKLPRPLAAGKSIDTMIALHAASTGKIIISYPGINGDIDGYNNKYGQIADIVQERIGTALRLGNSYLPDHPYPQSMIDRFRAVVEYAIANGEMLSGTSRPALYLMGFSAGASTVAAIAADYDSVEKILLAAPAGDAGMQAITDALGRYTGEIHITVGSDDEIVGPQAGEIFHSLATAARVRRLEVIPDCDHQFRGTRNGQILSKAPLWAFADDTTYPSPVGGRILY